MTEVEILKKKITDLEDYIQQTLDKKTALYFNNLYGTALYNLIKKNNGYLKVKISTTANEPIRFATRINREEESIEFKINLSEVSH